MIWSTSLILTVLLCISPVQAANDSRICYNPDGSQALYDVPCTSNATTWCCNRNDVCMSNGLCYLQENGGFALSRASCTDSSWNADGCYKYCWEINPSSGFPIVAASYDGNSTTYCCGTASYDNGAVTCGHGTASVPAGTAMPGVAALAVSSSTASPASNNSNSNSSHCDTSNYSSRGTAIGPGVGVPLGVIAVSSIAWAFWERRSRLKTVSQRSEMEIQGLNGFGGHFTDSVAPADLAHNPVSELCSQKGHHTPRDYS